MELWYFGTMKLWRFGAMALWHYGTMALAIRHHQIMPLWHYGTMTLLRSERVFPVIALPSRGQIMIEFLDTYAVNDEIPVRGGYQPPLIISADTEVLRCYHVLLAAELQQYSKKASILPVPSQNDGLDGEGISHLHDTVRLIVIVMKDVGVGVKHRSDTTVATCQDTYYIHGGRGRMMLVAMASTNPPGTSNA